MAGATWRKETMTLGDIERTYEDLALSWAGPGAPEQRQCLAINVFGEARIEAGQLDMASRDELEGNFNGCKQ